MVPDGHVCHRVANGLHNAGAFVAKHDGERAQAQFLHHQIGVADASRDNFDQHLIRPRSGKLQFFNPKRLAGASCNCCLDLQALG